MGADILNLKRKLGVHSKNRTSVQLGYSTWTKRRWDHGVGGGGGVLLGWWPAVMGFGGGLCYALIQPMKCIKGHIGVLC